MSADAGYVFGGLDTIILDELHALAPSKRGDLLSLGLARLATLAPGLMTLGLSATVARPSLDDVYRSHTGHGFDSTATGAGVEVAA